MIMMRWRSGFQRTGDQDLEVRNVQKYNNLQLVLEQVSKSEDNKHLKRVQEQITQHLKE